MIYSPGLQPIIATPPRFHTSLWTPGMRPILDDPQLAFHLDLSQQGQGNQFLSHDRIGHVVTRNGTPVATGQGGWYFDGASSLYTEVVSLGGSQITILAWVKCTGSVSSIVRQQNDSYIIMGYLGSLHLISNDTPGLANGLTVDGMWHHVGFTWKQNTTLGYVAYKDGKSVTSRDSANTALPTISMPVYIGSFNHIGQFLTGYLATVSILSRALSPQEVAEDYWLSKGERGG